MSAGRKAGAEWLRTVGGSRTFWSESGCFQRRFSRKQIGAVNALERIPRNIGHSGAADSLHSLQKSSP